MLNITIDELDDLRVKLLAGLMLASFPEAMAGQAKVLAQELDGLSTLLKEVGESAICVPSDEFGNLLLDALTGMGQPHE